MHLYGIRQVFCLDNRSAIMINCPSEKAGFKHEGRLRQFILRDDRRWDLIYMGILRSEWEQTQPEMI